MTASTEYVTPAQNLSGIVGQHLIYTYANGWVYESYIKNNTTIDYRIHSGDVKGRWVKDQQVELARLADSLFTVSWVEPTGSCVSVAINLADRWIHGAIFFANWVHQNAQLTALYQNDHLDEMRALRDKGPVAPAFLLDEFGIITFAENAGPDNEDVIACGPADLPGGYSTRTN
jgi:phenolic acid decarboxylase